MFFAFMGNHALDLLGIVYIVRVAVNATKRKPILSWFW